MSPVRVSGAGKQLCSCQCHPDLSWMKFGDTRIHPTDVDCLFVVERKGRFLWIEWKEEAEIVSDGQKILMDQLSYVPGFTVLVLRGTGGVPSTVTQIKRGEIGFPEQVDAENFQLRLDAWFLKANTSP